MSERIYKGTAEVNGVLKPTTYKIVNAPESHAGDLALIQKYHDNHKNIQLTQVYDSDRPANYASPADLAKLPELAPGMLTPLNPVERNPGNIPPREASIPPANAPTGSTEPTPVPVPPVVPSRATEDEDRADESR